MNSENNAIQSKLPQLLEQLRELQSTTKGNWRIGFVAVCYGVVAYLEGGSKFLLLYLGALVVIFLMHEINERRHKQQMNLIIELVEELKKQKQI